MKKTLLALLALSGIASATISEHTEGSSTYYTTDGTTYTYVRVGNDWKFLKQGETSGELTGPWGYYWPTGNDDALMGFDYAPATGFFTVAENELTISVSEMSSNAVWLGNTNLNQGDSTGQGTLTINLAANADVTISGAIGWKKDNTVLNYRDLTNSSALITQTGGAIWGVQTLTFEASYTMSGTATELKQDLLLSAGGDGFAEGSQNFTANFNVTDLNGMPMECVSGTVTSIDQLQVGQCGLMRTGNSFSLVARSAEVVPEPTTGTLSLLALAALAARRRRH